MITRSVEAKVQITPEEMAEEFANMGDDQQAVFFNTLAKITETWSSPFSFQLEAIVTHPALTAEARAVMSAIGEYAGVTP